LRLKILKKLRTASLNSEFTGSYKKRVQKMCIVVTIHVHFLEKWYPFVSPKTLLCFRVM